MFSAESEKWRSCSDVVAPGRIPGPGWFLSTTVFALEETKLVPFVALCYREVAAIFSLLKLPPLYWLLQNSFSENKLYIGSTMIHRSLASYFVSKCASVKSSSELKLNGIYHFMNAAGKHHTYGHSWHTNQGTPCAHFTSTLQHVFLRRSAVNSSTHLAHAQTALPNSGRE